MLRLKNSLQRLYCRICLTIQEGTIPFAWWLNCNRIKHSNNSNSNKPWVLRTIHSSMTSSERKRNVFTNSCKHTRESRKRIEARTDTLGNGSQEKSGRVLQYKATYSRRTWTQTWTSSKSPKTLRIESFFTKTHHATGRLPWLNIYQMKNVTKISIAFGSMALFWVIAYTGVHIPKNQTIDSLRIETAEARIREEEARKYREEREDAESQALYLECFHQATSGTWIRFDEKQRNAYDCWRTKTNWTGKLAPSSEPPLWTIIPNTTKNVSNQSTVWHNQTWTSWTWDKVQQAPQASRKPVATTVQNRPKIPVTPTVNKTWGNGSKGNNTDYWVSYEVAVKLIRKWEGLRLKSYWDFSHCSIGYGFSYPCGKSITQKQADKMLSDRVHSDLKAIRSDFPKLDSEAQWALISFKHNCPAWYKSIRKNWLKWFNSWCKTAWWDRLKWLVNRRAEEWRIISK